MRAHERLALAILSAVAPARDREALLGDLLEEHAARGGLVREALRSLPHVLGLRADRAGGAHALGFSLGLGALAALLVLLGLRALWAWVLFLVPLRAEGALPLTWWLAGLAPALLAAALAVMLGWRLARRLLGGRS